MRPKKASGSKKSAERPPTKKKGSKHSKEEMIEDDVVVDMDADEEEGGSQFEADRHVGCLLQCDRMRLMGEVSGLHGSCSGQATGSLEATCHITPGGLGAGAPCLTHWCAGLTQCGICFNISLSDTFDDALC